MALSSCTPSRQTRRSLALTLLIFAVIVAVFAFVFLVVLPEGYWKYHKSGGCQGMCENSDQCDHTMEERPIIQQPVNTWTNLAFILGGLWPLVGIRRDSSTVIFFLAETYVGITSFVFHASITMGWQYMDAAAARTSLCTLVLHGIYAVTGGRVSWRWLAPLNIVAAVIFSSFSSEIDDAVGSVNSWIVFASVLILLVSTLVVAHIRIILHPGIEQEEGTDKTDNTQIDKNDAPSKWKSILKLVLLAIMPGVLLAIAVIFNRLDNNKTMCVPDSFFQAHAVWHVLNAIASLWLWLFFDYHVVPLLGVQNQNTTIDDIDEPESGLTKNKLADLRLAETEDLSCGPDHHA